MKDISKQLRRWVRLLTIPLSRVPSPPVEIETRVGKGLHLLLKSHRGNRLLVSFLPSVSGLPAYFDTGTSVMRYLGDREPTEVQSEWLRALKQSLTEVERQSGWKEFLDWAADRPAVSLPVDQPSGARMTSGHAVLIRVNTRCNAHCDFCSARGVLPDLTRDAAQIKKRIEEAARLKVRMVSFTGGEPTLRPDLAALIEHARSRGVENIDLQTNGILLARQDLLDPLLGAGLSSIFMSLHSAKAEVHDSMLHVEGAFEKACRTADLCLQKGVEVRFNCVLTSLNYEGAPDYVRFIGKRFPEASQISLSFVALQGWALDHPELIPRLSEAAPRMAAALDAGRETDIEVRVPGLCGVPICVLPGYEESFDEFHDSDPPRLPTRGYVSACDDCRYRERCSGFWTEYFTLYGTDELGYQ